MGGECSLRGNSLNEDLKCELSPKNDLNHWMHYYQCVLGWMTTSRSTVGKLPLYVDSIGRSPPGDRTLRGGRLLGRGATDAARPGPTFALGLESKAVNGECFFCGKRRTLCGLMPSSAKVAGPSVNVGMQLPFVKHTHPTDRLVQGLYCGLELVVP